MSNHVKDLLDKHGIRYTENAKDYVMLCLNPEHNDTNPSYRVDKLTGVSHCFSCGYRVNIFTHFGVVANHVSIKLAKLKDKMKKLYINLNGVEFPEEMIPYTKSFRGISVQTLKKFGAFYTYGKETLEDRLFFPIKDITGKTIVYVGRHMLSQGNPRYLNLPSGVTMPIFPEVLEEKYTTVVLVEGIFDMLNLYDKGLRNVCCTFGTNNLTKDAAGKLLALKVQGITKIFIMFDGDTAGKEGASKLKPVLEEAGYEVEIISLEDDSDPGDLSEEYVTSIKEYVNNEVSTQS